MRKIDGKIIEYWERNISVVKIPASESPEIVPEKNVPFRHIENTFSNRIGQISNAAISIGQVEYGRNLKEEVMSISTINKPKLCLNQKIHLVKNVRY